MYQNKLTTSSMCQQFILSQQDYRMDPCKNKDSTNVKYSEMCKISNKYSNPNSNFKLVS